MARTLAQLQKQIAKLEREAELIRRKEVGEVVARIKEAIAFYGLSAADLGLSGAKRGAGRGGHAGAKKTASKVKYRDDQGHAWSGHGRRPQWFLDALSAGKTPEDLLA